MTHVQLPLLSTYTLMINLVHSALWSWDLVEYLRQLPREQLVRTASSSTDPRMALQQAVLEEKEEAEIVRHKEEVLCQHLNKSLEAWMEWTEAEWNVGGASDTHSSRESAKDQ